MKRLSFLILCFMLSLSAVAQQCWFTIQMRQPAALSTSVRDSALHTLLLVNNCVPQASSFGHQNKVDDVAASPSVINICDAPRQCLFGLNEGLENQSVFEEISLLDVSQNHSGSFYNRHLLSDAQTDSLCRLYGVDGVLMLNQLIIYDLQEAYLTDDESWYAYLQAYCSSHWSVHLLGQKGASSFTTADTLLWNAEKETQNAALAALPDRQTALLDFAYYSGEQLAKRLFPQWVDADRFLYIGKDTRFDEGLRLFSQQQWAAAADVWGAIMNDKSAAKLDIAYAAADVAVCLEMQEGFRIAVAMVDVAIKDFRKIHTAEAVQQVVNLQYYRTQLEQRQKYHFNE